MELAGQRVLVVGLGASGIAAARACHLRGARVTGADMRESLPETSMEALRGIGLELGPHRRETFLQADRIIVSPGVPSIQPDIVAAEAAGVEVMGELALAHALLAPHDPAIIGITGTNGKSTVTAFTGQLLQACGQHPFVGGNLGQPLCTAVPAIGAKPTQDPFVVECSSYQLERAGGFHPRAAVILNLSPDHLARHGTMEGYAAAKARICAHMGADDLLVVPPDPRVLGAVEAVLDGRAHRRVLLGEDIVLRGKLAEIRIPGRGLFAIDLSEVAIPGTHNLHNAAVAACLALDSGCDPTEVQHGLSELVALEHRMEVVYRGATTWINDSKATNLDAARVGLEGLDGRGIVMLGGRSKGPGFQALIPMLREHRAVICFGGDGPQIADELEAGGLDVHRVERMEAAIELARELARPGDVVLLSPGGSSFDHYPNFAERGRIFRERVQSLFSASEGSS